MLAYNSLICTKEVSVSLSIYDRGSVYIQLTCSCLDLDSRPGQQTVQLTEVVHFSLSLFVPQRYQQQIYQQHLRLGPRITYLSFAWFQLPAKQCSIFSRHTLKCWLCATKYNKALHDSEVNGSGSVS